MRDGTAETVNYLKGQIKIDRICWTYRLTVVTIMYQLLAIAVNRNVINYLDYTL